MKLFELIERIRDVSTSHKYVKSFHTGKSHEVNKRMITYPAVFMSFPYTKNASQGFGINDYVRYSFDIDIVTNQYYGFDITGTTSADTFNTNYMISSDVDENTEFKDENKLRETSLAIGQHIISKMIDDDFSTVGYDLNLINYQIRSLERVNNDYVTGIRLRMEVETTNDYQCEYESFFHSPTPEVICKSLQFDGVNDYIDCGNNVAFDFEATDSFSFETWVKFDVTSGPNILLGKITSGNNGYYFGVVDSEVRMFLRTSVSNILNVNTVQTLSTGVWYHLVGTYSGNLDESGVNIYINSSNQSLTSNSNNLASTGMINTEPFQIGGDITFFSDCTIAKTRVWNIELTSGEVTTQFNGGIVQPTPVQSSRLVVDTDIPNSTFSTQWLVPDLTSITAGYNSVSMESDDLIDDCPPT